VHFVSGVHEGKLTSFLDSVTCEHRWSLLELVVLKEERTLETERVLPNLALDVVASLMVRLVSGACVAKRKELFRLVGLNDLEYWLL